MLNKAEISQLKQLMKEEGWEILLRVLAGYINELNAENITGQNAFEALRALHSRQGKVEGLTEFFEHLDKKAFE